MWKSFLYDVVDREEDIDRCWQSTHAIAAVEARRGDEEDGESRLSLEPLPTVAPTGLPPSCRRGEEPAT
nr:hypothetical protein Iba_chr14dCG13140 [Ipomoea batatas]